MERYKRRIACQVWFPVGREPYPILFKFQDDDGVVQTVNNISIHNIETRFAGSFQTNEYRCKAIICDRMMEFKITYDLKTSEWYMVI